MSTVALFDFCETLVSFQTADAFVDFVRAREGRFRMKTLDLLLRVLNKLKVISVFNKLFPGNAFSKKLKLLQIKGFYYGELNNLAKLYYKEMIRPQLIKPLVDEMSNCVKQGHEIYLVSAGYSIYLKYFAEEFKIRHLISTEFEFEKEECRCRGRILGKDCINEEKVNRLNTFLKDQDVDFSNSISYSDSISDLPMLLLTGTGVVVSRSQAQSWYEQYNFKEIIWDEM